MKRARRTAIALCALALLCSQSLFATQPGKNDKKVSPLIVWLPPSPLTEGIPLGSKQLNAIASVPGTFKYDPPAGTILPVGPNQTLSADFTPHDLGKYKPVNGARTQITIIPKLPSGLKWKNPKEITYGTPLGDDQLNATADVDGTFEYSPLAGTVLEAGDNQELKVTFTPTDTLLFNTEAKMVHINVKKVNLSVVAQSTSKIYGTSNPPFTITYSGFVNGETPDNLDVVPVATSAANETSVAGKTYPIVLSEGADNNYSIQYTNGSLTITKAALTAIADGKTRKFGQPNPGLTITYIGFVNGETAAVLDTPPVATTTAMTTSPAGTYPITLTPGQDNNYNFSYTNGILTITTGSAPSISNFQIVTDEDSNYLFEYRLFHQNFAGYPGDSIVSIKIVQTPSHGNLSWKEKNVAAGENISVVHGKLESFYYYPAANYNGKDTIIYNISDGTQNAAANAFITIYVAPTNDPPLLSKAGADALIYSAGDAPLIVAQGVVLDDPDDDQMVGASVLIEENHLPGDVLAITGFSSPGITTTYSESEGLLTLTGSDSKANYQESLRHVAFSSPASAEANTSSRTLTFTVTDGKDNSTPMFRLVQFSNYPEVGLVSAFTPNHDGVNDYWDFVNLETYKEIRITVFDQNGSRVFDCNQPDCKWDGMINGKELPAGPYFFNIDLAAGKKIYRGTVTILK